MTLSPPAAACSYGDVDGEGVGVAEVGSGDCVAVPVSPVGSPDGSEGAGWLGLGALLSGGEDWLSGDVEVEPLGEVPGELPASVLGDPVDDALLPSDGVPVGPGPGVESVSTGGASPRIATISVLNPSNRVVISESE